MDSPRLIGCHSCVDTGPRRAVIFGQARLGYAQAKSQRYLDTAQLFEAMGGAWWDWKEPAIRTDGEPR